MHRPAGVAAYGHDLYSTNAIIDPYPHYATLRQMGAVVWLTKQRVFAVPRYAECKAVLRDDATFASGQGVALNPIANRLSRGTVLNSDGEEHDQRRKLLAHRLLPRALRSTSDVIAAQAANLVAAAVKRECVDGVADLARALPLAVVPDLLGWPRDGRDNLLSWGAATFDVLGPANHLAARAVPAGLQMMRFTKQVVCRRSVADGSMGHDILAAADAGKLPRRDCSALMIDYLAPSLDTTISGIASSLALFARHPDQWQLLRTEPTLLPNAINEVLRYESPLRAFSRKLSQDSTIAGVDLPAGARVLVIYASANRDEREWIQPDTFDIRRDANR
jgi:cytochrome P450